MPMCNPIFFSVFTAFAFYVSVYAVAYRLYGFPAIKCVYYCTHSCVPRLYSNLYV